MPFCCRKRIDAPETRLHHGASGTAVIQHENSRKVPGIPFTKNDPRINRRGRPRSFDQLRALAQEIAHEEITDKNGRKLTRAAAILRIWSRSKDLAAQKAFMEYAFGKVPDKIENPQFPKRTLILHYGHERPDYEGPNSERSASSPKQLSDGNLKLP